MSHKRVFSRTDLAQILSLSMESPLTDHGAINRHTEQDYLVGWWSVVSGRSQVHLRVSIAPERISVGTALLHFNWHKNLSGA